MLLEFITYISLLISSLYLISRYYTKHRKPLNVHSSLRNKLIIGFFYGLTGALLMYIHKSLAGNVADLRQLVVMLALFYGGWIPALVSTLMVLVARLILFSDTSIWSFIISMVSTWCITILGMRSKLPKSKQWYLITVAVMLQIYTLLWLRGDYQSFHDTGLLQFAVAFILGSIVSYHFVESLQQTYQMNEELRRSKENLEISEANYRLITENSTDLICVLNYEGRSEYLSPSHYPILGLIPNDQLGNSLRDSIHSDDYPHIHKLWTEAIVKRRAFKAEYRYKHANGQWIWIESHFVPAVCAQGHINKMVLISRDVTERKQTEAIMRDKEKLFVVGELAAGIAHEIRNPLTTLKGFIQMMKKESTKPYYLDVMYEELNRIDEITSELLYLGKPQVQYVRESSLEELLNQVGTLLEPQALMNGILLRMKFEPNLPKVQCVENHMKQVFINLLKNSVEAMPGGGEIVLEAKREDDFLLISVKDNGIGIAGNRMERLGQPFYTLKDKGTGLGLTVCKKIIQEHNGTISFHSVEGAGTVVEVRLPLIAPFV